jgi:hypothetical protein
MKSRITLLNPRLSTGISNGPGDLEVIKHPLATEKIKLRLF